MCVYSGMGSEVEEDGGSIIVLLIIQIVLLGVFT